MRLITRPRLNPAAFEACRASLRDWLVATLLWLIETLEPARRWRHAPAWLRRAIAAAERRLDQHLREAALDLRKLLIAYAYARTPAIYEPAFQRTSRPGSVRRGKNRNSFVRKITSTALKGLHTGSLRQRAERLRDLVENLDPLIDAVFVQLGRMLKRGKAPSVITLFINDAPPHATPFPRAICADTS